MTASPINSIRDVAAVARGRRRDLGLSQAELAARAHVSRQWLSGFESGKPGAELRLVIRLLDTLGLRLMVDELRPGDRGRKSSPGAVDLDELLDEHRAP